MYSLELPHQGNSNEYTKHTIIIWKIKKKFPLIIHHLLPDLAPGLTLNGSNYPSRTNFHGPKEVRAIEVWLYIHVDIFLYFSPKVICCGYSLEVPHWGTSDEDSQYILIGRSKKKEICIQMYYSYSCVRPPNQDPYCMNPEYLDRHAWANSVGSDQIPQNIWSESTIFTNHPTISDTSMDSRIDLFKF